MHAKPLPRRAWFALLALLVAVVVTSPATTFDGGDLAAFALAYLLITRLPEFREQGAE